MTDAEHLRRYLQTGEKSAAEALLAPYHQPLFNYLRGFLSRHHDAEDALQETYYRAIRALPNYRDENQFRACRRSSSGSRSTWPGSFSLRPAWVF